MENGNINETTNGAVNGVGSNDVVQMDYNTDFPTLPDAGPNVAPAAKPTAVWARPSLTNKMVTTTFRLASDERSNKVKTFGSSNEEHKKAQNIAAQTGTRIELSESKDGELTVVVKGDRSKVEEARTKLVRELQTQASREITIPKEHHRRLIGKEGSALRQLEQDTNCRINFPPRDATHEIIKITGPREGIDRAAAHILAVSERESKIGTETIFCSKTLYPYIRGPYNETIDRISSETKAKINIPPPSATNEMIIINGEKEGVHRAAEEIRSIIQSKANVKSITFQVARPQHRYIIGQQRSGIHEILKQTGVIVDVPSEESGSDKITLLGDPNNLSMALELVVTRASSVITQQISAPTWLHKHLIGPKGATLSSLVPNRNNVQIEFEDNGTIFIEGSPQEVKVAFDALSKEVERLKSEMAIEKIKVNPSLHRHVIGRGGSLISKIKDQTGVQINIPNESTHSDEITIEGKKEGVAKAVKEITDIVLKMENEKSRDLIVPQRLHKLIIGTKGEGINKLREAHPTVTILFPDAKQKSDIVSLRGDKQEVDNIHKKLTKIAKDLAESNYQETVVVFKEFLKHIVGKSGATIRKIRDETETRIDLPEAGSLDDKIFVTGKQDNVKKAVLQLNKIQEELANIVEEVIEIPTKVQSRLLGNGRRLISDIEEECGGVHIRFPSEKSESTKVTVRGPSGDVAKASQLLSSLAKDKEQNLVEDTVKAKPEFHRFLIGKGGSKIAKLRDGYDVRIMFPRESDAEKEIIHLLGKKEDVQKAKVELEESIRQLAETVEVKIDIDTKYHRHFLSQGAAVVKEVQEQNGGVIISFPSRGAESASVTLKGSKQCVESAKARLEEIVEDFEKQVKIQVPIPSKFHRSLLAGRGQKIHEIQSRFNVQIRFPDRREESSPNGEDDLVAISGRDTKVEEAKEALLALVPVSKTIMLPVEMHRGLIGRGGENVRNMMADFDVNIAIPKDNHSEEITVTGQIQNVENALDAIREKLVEYEGQAEDRKLRAFQLVIEIPNEYHVKVIGPKGAIVNALREKYAVQISLPKGDEKSDNIAIQGYEDKARACAAEIEGMISDLRSLFTQDISVDARFHPRLIGNRGKNLRKVMDEFNVEIRLPRAGADDPNLVVIAGKDENNVYDCIDYVRAQEEEFLQDSVERTHFLSPRHQDTRVVPTAASVQIRGAPWQLDIGSSEEFPDMGAAAAAAATVPTAAVGGAWGSGRRW